MKVRRVRAEGEISAASMPDIAFLLIIFFIVTATFMVRKGLDLTLPPPEAPVKKVLAKKLLIIQINEKELKVNEQVVSLNGLREVIQKKKAEIEKLYCLVKISPQAFYGRVVEVLDVLRENKIMKVALKTL
jgi:biopolymer transport protein ExbD